MNDPGIQAFAEQVGKTVRTARMLTNTTQVELAKRVGIDTVYLSNIETGYEIPSLPLLYHVITSVGLRLELGLKAK